MDEDKKESKNDINEVPAEEKREKSSYASEDAGNPGEKQTPDTSGQSAAQESPPEISVAAAEPEQASQASPSTENPTETPPTASAASESNGGIDLLEAVQAPSVAPPVVSNVESVSSEPAPVQPQTPEPPVVSEAEPADTTRPIERPERRAQTINYAPAAAAIASPMIDNSKPVQNFVSALLSKANAVLTSRREKKLNTVLAMAVTHKTISNDQVEKVLRTSHRTASRYLQTLVKRGKLRLLGDPHKAKYELVQ
jgi:hypothetical protein